MNKTTTRKPMTTTIKMTKAQMTASVQTEQTINRFFDTDDLIVVNSKARQRNEERAYSADLEPCYLCGKGVAEGKGWDVRGHGSRSYLLAVSEWATYVDDGSDMGIGKVGPECGKKIPAPYKRKGE